MTMASPFVALLAICAAASCAMVISCQESGQAGYGGQLQGGHGGQEGHGLHGGRVKRQQGPNSVDFLVKEDQTATRQIVLHDNKLHCEIIFGIKIKPIASPKQEYDYEDYVEENKTEPAGEAGEVKLTLTHPNFRDGQEEIVITVDENGSGRKKETVCFKHCANITEYTQIISLSAKSDLKSTVDVGVVQEKGNHECQKDKIIVIEKPVINETYKVIAETNEKRAKGFKTEAEANKRKADVNNTKASIFGSLLAVAVMVIVVLIILLNKERKKNKAGTTTNEEKSQSNGDQEMVMLPESEDPSRARGGIRNMKRGPCSAGPRGEEEKAVIVIGPTTLGNKGSTGSKKLCSRYRILIISTFISLLLAFIFAILTVLSLA